MSDKNNKLLSMASRSDIVRQAYFKRIGYVPHQGQILYHNSQARFRLANCGRRFGKAESITNEIPMADGTFKLMRDVNQGDSVLGPDGLPTEVIDTTDVMYNHDCAKVIFNDHTEVVVDKGHLWQVVDKAARKALVDPRRIYREKVLTTSEMQSTVKTSNGKESNYAVTLASPVHYQEQNLAVDPYLLGVWLGDGAKGGNIITTIDEEILEQLTALGFTYTHRSKYDYYVNGLRGELEKAGYKFDYINLERTTKSLATEKFVPEQYLIGNVQQRLALLQGLMDTDGTIGKNGHVQFTSTTKNLADSVYQLVTSLGMKGHRYERVTSYTYKSEKKSGKKSYTIHFWPLLEVFRLSRKQARVLPTSPSQQYRFITKIEDHASVPVKCIKVARKDGLYLTSRNYIVTHNSFMAARDLEPKLLEPNKRFWIVGPTYDLAEKEFRVIWRDMIVNLGFGKDPSVSKVYNKRQGNMHIEFTDRNTILEVRSAQNPENLVGESLDGVIMSEAAKHTQETWDRYIRPALGDRRGFADFTTTPEGFNWLYDEWMRGQDETFPEYNSWRFPSYMNDIIFPGGVDDPEIKLLKRTMPKDAFTQEIEADFGSFVGKIFPEWDVSKHVKNHTFRPDWPNYIGFDIGYTNPLAAIEFQVSPQDTIHIWREHYKPYMRIEEHIRELKSREQPEGYHITMCTSDAADPEAAETLNNKFAPTVANPLAKVNWRDGIDLMRSFMERDGGEDEFGGKLDEVPAYFVDPSCEQTIREHNNYKAPQNSSGKNVTEMGIKMDDHAIDAIRYALVTIYRLGAGYSLQDVSTEPEQESSSTAHSVVKAKPITDSSGLLFAVNSASEQQEQDPVGGFTPLYESSGISGFFTQLGEF